MNIVVVGKGIAGLCTAYYLSKNKNNQISVYHSGSCVSRVGQGMISQRGNQVRCDPKNQARWTSAQMLLKIFHDLQFTGYQQGLSEPFFNEAEKQRAIGYRQRDDLYQIKQDVEDPFFSNLKGKIFYPQDIHFDVGAFLDRLEDFLQAQGVRFFAQKIGRAALEEFREKSTHSFEGIGQKRSPSVLILACGEGNKDFIRAEGCLEGVYGEVLDFGTEGLAKAGVEMPGEDGYLFQYYSMSRTGSKISIGGTHCETKDEIHGEREKIQEFFKEKSAFFEKFRILDVRSGCRIRLAPAFRKKVGHGKDWPFIAQRQQDPVYMIGGFYKSGYQLAPLASYLLAEEILAAGLVGQKAPNSFRDLFNLDAILL